MDATANRLPKDNRTRPTADPQVLLDVPSLAERLSVTQRFVLRLIAEDRVPYLKIGKFIRFDPAQIENWLDDQRVQPPSPGQLTSFG